MTKDKLTKLITKFNFNSPTEKEFKPLLPFLTGEIKDLKGINGNVIGKFNAIKTLWEIDRAVQPKQRSRVWNSPQGYKFLVQWSNSILLRLLGIKLFEYLRSPKFLYNPLNSSNKTMGWKLFERTEAQFLDSLRSVIANIEEGFARPTTSEYLQFIGYSQGSLKEARGDIERMLQDDLIKSVKGSKLLNLGIDLKSWNNWAKDPLSATKLLYFPLEDHKGLLKDIKGQDISYEMLIELVNKTDYLLRKLVESLEKKLDDERMYYKVEQARIKERTRRK